MQIDQTNYIDRKGIANYIPEPNTQPGLKVTTEHAAKTETMSVSSSGNVNLAGATYGRPEQEKKTVVEELEKNQGQSVKDRRNQMAVLSNTMSPEDYKKAKESGFDPSETSGKTIITVTDEIKAVLAKAGVDISGYGDSLSREELEEITGSAFMAAQICNQLASYDLPVTVENVENMQKAYEKADAIESIGGEAMSYLIRNGKEPTIENIYCAEYSGAEGNRGNYATPVSEQDFEAMRGQVEQIIEKAGYPVNEKSLADCKWLLDNGLPLTRENLTYYGQLQELSGQLQQGRTTQEADNFILSAMAEAIAEGKNPLEGMHLSGYSDHSRAELAMEVISDVTDEDLAYCIDRQEPLTIENLAAARANRGNGAAGSTGRADVIAAENASRSDSERAAALITARRQLEEVRLAMTAEANYALLKRGISIDTKPLADLVEDLKNQENQYYKDLLEQSGIEATPEKVTLFADTSRVMEELKSYPASVLDLYSEGDTLHSLHEAGAGLQETFAKANERYETLMTAPRADMGDSIQKAFRNVDDILQDLGLECSEANRRAVRILAYNSTEINEENIYAMKAKDEEVQRAFSNMTPKTTLEMIRREINPLDLDIQELNRTAEEIRREMGDEEQERFSKYLWKLEQNRQITQEERDAYIGIYRLIAQVEKTDGAVIGSLLNQGADITMRNLLTAVRSGKKGAMDYEVNDDFAGTTAKHTNRRIDEQIESTYQQNCVRDIKEQMSPELMQEIGQENWENMTPEQLKEALVQSAVVGEATGTAGQSAAAETTGEALAQSAAEGETIGTTGQNVAAGDPAGTAGQAADLEEAYIREQLSAYKTAQSVSEDVYTYLERNDIPDSVQNIFAVQQMLQEPGRMFQVLWNDKENAFDRKRAIDDAKALILERFGKAMGNPEEMAQAQEALAETAAHVMDDMILEQENVTSVDVRMMRLANRQFSICAKQAREENYMIPMETVDGVTGVNLKIIRGREEKGWVDILFHDTGMGKVAASFEAREQGISGLIVTDNEETRRLLSDQLGRLAENMQGDGGEPMELRVAVMPALSLEHYAVADRKPGADFEGGVIPGSDRNPAVASQGVRENPAASIEENNPTEKNPVQTKRLYHIAEQFIRTIGELNGSAVM